MSPKRFPTLTFVAAGLAALVAAGCGDDKTTETPAPASTTAQKPAATTPATTAPSASGQDPVAAALVATDSQEGGLAIAFRGTVTTRGQELPTSGSGTVDRKAQRGTFTIKTTLGARPFTIKEITDKNVLYINSEVFGTQLPGGKSWLRVDLAAAARKPELSLAAFGTTGPASDPTQALDYLHGAGPAKKVGTAKVRGVATTRYRVTVDLKRAAQRSPTAAGKRSIAALTATLNGKKTVPVDVWVDDQSLVRRQQVRYTATVGGVSSDFDLTTDYTDFDAAVKTSPPADSDTYDGLKLLEQAAASRQG